MVHLQLAGERKESKGNFLRERRDVSKSYRIQAYDNNFRDKIISIRKPIKNLKKK